MSITRRSIDQALRKAHTMKSTASRRGYRTKISNTSNTLAPKGAFPLLFALGGGCYFAFSDEGNEMLRSVASLNTTVIKCNDVLMLQTHKEPSTGILFPGLCNGLSFVGCGVRVKYGFVKVYAVGTYMDPIAMSAVKNRGPEEVEKALLDPSYPRTIRIVMNRGLSIEKYTAAIVESLGPRMNGEDMDKLDEFKKLNPPVDLIEGAEMEMTVRGDVMLYKNSVGGVGQIQSAVFCRALCDVYYGSDPVSPAHKAECIKGVQKL